MGVRKKSERGRGGEVEGKGKSEGNRKRRGEFGGGRGIERGKGHPVGKRRSSFGSLVAALQAVDTHSTAEPVTA